MCYSGKKEGRVRVKPTSFFPLFLLWPLSVSAFPLAASDPFSLSLKGYFKELAFTSERQATGDRYLGNLNRLRTEWDLQAGAPFSAKLVWDNEVIGGNYVQAEEFAAGEATKDFPFPDMNFDLVHRRNFFYGQNFFRAYAKYDSDHLIVTAGRQKIDWGVMRMISPLDLFTLPSFFNVEREERSGMTAVNVMVPVGGLRINPVYAAARDFDRSRTGVRVTRTVGHFDLSLLGGRFLRDGIYGFDFSGDLGDLGVRGEFLFDDAAEGGNFPQAAAGVDYGFENSLYFALEYLFNGQGTNNPATALPFPNTASFLQAVHQNFLIFQAHYDLTPLWKGILYGAGDLNGASLFVNPETRYSLYEWMELAAGAQFSGGQANGEFSSTPDLYYLQAQLFF